MFDQRGSGGSGLLRCPELEKANILRAAGPAARCAAKLGPRRDFYASRDTADDLESIRRQLGAAKLSLYGVSYGTRTAAAYALRYPARVDRMVLDSVVAPDGADALSVDSFRAVPRVLRALCAGRRCDRFTRDPVADVAALTQRIGRRAACAVACPTPAGAPRAATLARYDVFSALVSGDFEPAMRTAFPGAVKAALDGDPAPLLRLDAALDRAGERGLRAPGAEHRAVRRHHLLGGAPALAAYRSRRSAPRAGHRRRRAAGARPGGAVRHRHRPGQATCSTCARAGRRPRGTPPPAPGRCPTCPRC